MCTRGLTEWVGMWVVELRPVVRRGEVNIRKKVWSFRRKNKIEEDESELLRGINKIFRIKN